MYACLSIRQPLNRPVHQCPVSPSARCHHLALMIGYCAFFVLVRARPNEEKNKKTKTKKSRSFRFSFFDEKKTFSFQRTLKKTEKTSENDRCSTLKLAVQLDRIFQSLQHPDSRRLHPTTLLNTPNSRTRGIPESRRCSRSRSPRECSRSCVLVWMFVGSRWITGWRPH